LSGDEEKWSEDDWNLMAKQIVSMYRALWVEVGNQFSECSAEERLKVCSFIAPFINNMFTSVFNEGLMEELLRTHDKRKKKR